MDEEKCTLTPSELELIRQYQTDLCCKQMADELGITINTLYEHQRNIIEKLNLPSIAHCVMHACKKGWV